MLSIIIPTKNRQYTCLYAIESALLLQKEDIEIIVQDCSDTDSLKSQIIEKFGTDHRIRYEYTDTKPSMTDNWNRAFARATGEYLCGIGDDDAVLPSIYDVTLLAKSRQIQAVTQTKFTIYLWPGFTPQPFDGTLSLDDNYSGKYTVVTDLDKRVTNYSKLTNPMSYINLPQAYHCIFSRKLKEELEALTGSFLQSTSLDIYTAIAFNKFIKSYLEADFAFTIRGSSMNSNTQRLFSGRSKEHFSEYKNIEFPVFLPKTVGLNVTAVESFVKACKNTQQKELINNIDLPVLYAQIALENKEDFKISEDKLKEYVASADERKRFYKHYYGTIRQKFLANTKEKTFSIIKKLTPFVYTIYRKLIPLKVTRIVVHAETIKDALVFLAKK